VAVAEGQQMRRRLHCVITAYITQHTHTYTQHIYALKHTHMYRHHLHLIVALN